MSEARDTERPGAGLGSATDATDATRREAAPARPAPIPRWVDALGWLGTGIVLLAHFLANADRVDADAFAYHGLNLLGSVLLGYLCVRRRVWQSVWLNAIWGAVAAIAIARVVV